MTEHVPRFRRAPTDERRGLLIDATLRCLAAEGHAGISVRRIAREAGVSVGLVNHHFGSIDALIADAYRTLSLDITHSLHEEVARHAAPASRLEAFLAASFSPRVLDRDLLSVWVVFWGLIRHSPAVHDAHEEGYSTYRALVEQLLCDLAQAEGFALPDPALAAIALSAVLDGLWLEWCLNPATFSPQNGLAICRSWVAGLRLGAFAGVGMASGGE